MAEKPGVQSVERIFQLIEQLAAHPTGVSLQKLAGEPGLAKSTVHRLLARYLEGGKTTDKATFEALCAHASEREVIAAEADRAVIIRDGRIHDGAYIPHAPKTLRSAVDSLPMISASANPPKGVVV